MSEKCNRCGAPNADELCWYCCEWLCVKCWEELGHCVHPEAERANEMCRNASSYDERKSIALDAIANGHKETN